MKNFTQEELIDLGMQHRKDGLKPLHPKNKFYMRGYNTEAVFPGLKDFKEEELLQRWNDTEEPDYYNFFNDWD